MSAVTSSAAPIVPPVEGAGVNAGIGSVPFGAEGLASDTASSGTVSDAPVNATAFSATPNTATLPASMKLPLGFQKLTLETLGIRMPSTPQDTAAILAEVAQQLDKIMDEASAARSQQIANALRSLIGSTGGLAASIAQHREEYNRLDKQRTAKADAVEVLVDQRQDLINERASLVGERTSRNQQVSMLNSQITAVENQIAAVAASGGDTTTLVAARDTMVEQRDQAQSRIDILTGQISQLDSHIQALDTEIAQKNVDVDELREKMDDEKASYESLEALQAIAMSLVAQFELGISTRETLAKLEGFNWNEDIDRLFDNLVETLKQLERTSAATGQGNSQLTEAEAAGTGIDKAGIDAAGINPRSAAQAPQQQSASAPPAPSAPGASQQANGPQYSAHTTGTLNGTPDVAPALGASLSSANPVLPQRNARDLSQERKLAAEALALASVILNLVATLGALEPLPEGAQANMEDTIRFRLAV